MAGLSSPTGYGENGFPEFCQSEVPDHVQVGCGRFGSSFEMTTASTIAGPSMAKASVSTAFNSPGFVAANP
jgi:hypothetical protein